MNFELPKIYPITNVSSSGLSHAEQIAKLIAGGARLIQLREKHGSPREFFEDANLTIQIARKSGVQIIINDRVDIALTLKADGVHLGQDDLPPEKAREILGPDAIIGFSTHSVEQAITASRLPIDYIAIGPIFKTLTKADPDDVVGLEGLTEVRKAVLNFPLVAIGGITLEHINVVLNAGADSAAVISAIVSVPTKIEACMRNFIDQTR